MPQLHVDTEVVGRNTEVVAALLREHGLDLVGVTKGCLGEPRVGAAMLAGGATALADTRDHNLRRLRDALPRAELHRIYLPPLGSPFETGDVTYVSTAAGAAAVAAAPATPPVSRSAWAFRAGAAAARRVVLAVETGDCGRVCPSPVCSPWRRRSPRTLGWNWPASRPTTPAFRAAPRVFGGRSRSIALPPASCGPPACRWRGSRAAIPACSRSCARGRTFPRR